MPTCATPHHDEPGIQQFQALYEDNLSSIYHFVLKNLRNPEEAEDLAAQIFLKALRFLDTERSTYSMRSWLFQIARTTIADYWRSYYRTPINSLDMLLELDWEGPTEEILLDANDLASQRAHILLLALPERYREVLTCRFLLNLSIRETSLKMGISEANVKVLQFRAIKFARTRVNSVMNL